MAATKFPLGRYLIIDRELSSKEFVKVRDLCNLVNKELGKGVSERMINEDLRAMRDDAILGYRAPIKYVAGQRAWRYTDETYTIRAYGLRQDDISAISFYANALNQYRGYDIFKDFENAIDKVLDAVDIRKGIQAPVPEKKFVMTEPFMKFKGNEWISEIISAISANRVLLIDYQKFDDISKSREVNPYLLKEDRHRWYLIATYKDRFTTFGLDRINSLQALDKIFDPVEFDPDEYFRYSFGITVNGDTKRVELSFTPSQGNYLKTLPIHPTQEVLADDSSEFRIVVQVKPSYEFYEKILGYGANVTILSPPDVVAHYKTKLHDIIKKYD